VSSVGRPKERGGGAALEGRAGGSRGLEGGRGLEPPKEEEREGKKKGEKKKEKREKEKEKRKKEIRKRKIREEKIEKRLRKLGEVSRKIRRRVFADFSGFLGYWRQFRDGGDGEADRPVGPRRAQDSRRGGRPRC
jgi:hypothetical protein